MRRNMRLLIIWLWGLSITEGEIRTQIYAATGSTAVFSPLLNNWTGFSYLWTYENTKISNASVKSTVFTVFPNGTLRVTNVDKTATGIYTSEAFTSEGTYLLAIRFHLTVLDAVSLPAVTHSSSWGLPLLHCSVEKGDDVRFQWRYGNGTDVRPTHCDTLYMEDRCGTVICVAHNAVSMLQSQPFNFTCTGKYPHGFQHGWCFGIAGALLLLFSASVIAYCTKRHNQKHPSGTAETAVMYCAQYPETPENVEYSEVRIYPKRQ